MNIVLIGMPGSGKTTVGISLARVLEMAFLDTDVLMRRQSGKTLAELIATHGQDGFRELENQTGESLQVENTVISTGGSMIYGQEAMRHLKELGTVLYLQLSYDQIEKRLGDLSARGVTLQAGQTLKDLYQERTPLYEQWADHVIPCDGLRLRQVILDCQAALR